MFSTVGVDYEAATREFEFQTAPDIVLLFHYPGGHSSRASGNIWSTTRDQ